MLKCVYTTTKETAVPLLLYVESSPRRQRSASRKIALIVRLMHSHFASVPLPVLTAVVTMRQNFLGVLNNLSFLKPHGLREATAPHSRALNWQEILFVVSMKR